MLRPDLDGLLIGEDEAGPSFLVFGGRRHVISDQHTSEALFAAPKVRPTDLKAIDEGHALQKGTCLMRDDQGGSIYLVAVYGEDAKRHRIKDWESFLEFGFAFEQVVEIPQSVLRLVPDGLEISGAMSRVGRW